MLPVNPGDRVLDICAAPGGKSTELAAKLGGTGVLFSNDISNSRAKALLKNLELFGSASSVILSEAPGKLTERFRGYFDKILIDAPCSGEGMFRKTPAIMKNWEQYGTEYYHKLQLEIIDAVVPMLAPGGMMVYSTCTFDPSEDEGSIDYILEKWPDMHVVKPENPYEKFSWGRPELIGSERSEISGTVRLWPHILEGEGHYSALLKRDEDPKGGFCGKMYEFRAPKLPDEVREFFKHVKKDIPLERTELRENRLYLVPEGIPDLKGLRIMRTGLLLGEIAKNRFEPSQALASALKADEYDNVYSMSVEDEDVVRYLKCETIEPKNEVSDGYVLACVDGFPLGWAKAKGNSLKNKYLPGWRMM
jgi:NOL1/NOP2/fmu family ribosome biogenesis protein/23S rRNA U2552 (ribose-2'-O)-methylase RlmE/FtsJ